MHDELYKYIVTALIAIAGTIIGSYFTYYFSIKKLKIEENRKLKERSYSKFYSLKIPWSQAMRTLLEAELLSYLYEYRALLLTKNSDDYNESKRQNERMLSSISNFSNIQREVFETLADIRIAYDITPEIEKCIDSLYHYQMLSINPPDKETVKNENDLDNYNKKANEAINKMLKINFEDKFDSLNPLLYKQIRKN